MWPFRSQPRSYGNRRAVVQRLTVLAAFVFLCGPVFAQTAGQTVLPREKPMKIVALGDSLTAGHGLPAKDAFPTKLDQALKAKGAAATIVNAGLSGDTARGGLDRLAWSVPEGSDAVIVELGANDMLRGIDPKLTKAALDRILDRLAQRHIPVLLAGMKAAPNMGVDFAKEFDAIYPALASTHSVVFYPFFLDGVAGDPKLNQGDGMHPTATGVDVIVKRILPKVETLIARARAAQKK
jgi:acyl-CoA thioesterase-1